MLRPSTPLSLGPGPDTSVRDPIDDLTIDLGAIARFLVSNMRVLIAGALIGLLAGGIWSVVQTKRYDASARVLFGTVRGAGADQRTTIDTGIGDMPIDAQMELIRSDAIVERVIDSLRLDTDNRARSEYNRLSQLKSLIGRADKPMDRAALVEAVLRRLEVKRVGRSPIFEITFSASDPTLAADVANAFSNAYVEAQVAANAALSAKTSQWLATRIADLRAKSAAKDEEISTYKARHDLQVDAGGANLVEKRLADLNTELLKAQAALTALKGKQKQLDGLASSGVIADVTDAMDDPGINRLRQKYFAALERRTDLAVRISSDNGLLKTVDREIDSLRAALIERSQLAAAATSHEIEITQARIEALEAERAVVVERARTTEAATAHLMRLRAEAEVLSKSYSDSLNRYETALRDQTYPVADSRVIAQAETPKHPVNGGPIRMGVIFSLLGLMLALAVCAMKQVRRSGAHAPTAAASPAPIGRAA